jgi:hypothetical protein
MIGAEGYHRVMLRDDKVGEGSLTALSIAWWVSVGREFLSWQLSQVGFPWGLFWSDRQHSQKPLKISAEKI